MYNYEFELHVRGPKEGVEKFENILTGNSKKRFVGICEANLFDEENLSNDTIVHYYSGYLRWNGNFTFVSKIGDNNDIVTFSDFPNLEIELYTSDAGNGFEEHILFEKENVKYESKNATYYWLDSMEYPERNFHNKESQIQAYLSDHDLPLSLVEKFYETDEIKFGGFSEYVFKF